jgi:hypothetical protein
MLIHKQSRSTARMAAMIAGVISCLVTISAVAQQGDTAERLLECDRLSDPELKLACYDAVVTGLREDASADPREDRLQDEAGTAEQDPGDDRVSAAPAQAETVLPAGTAAAESGKAEPGASPGSSSSPQAVDDDFGLEDQRAAEQREEERARELEESIEATIVKVTIHNDRRFSVQLDNGQIWRETEGTRVGVPKEGAVAVVTAGKLGGYRMKIDGIARQAWVRRVK